MRLLALAVAGTLIGSSLNPAFGASLRVAPVLLDLSAPTAASKIRAWNDGDRAINVQVRVFRWKQVGGEDVYEPTRDVVASPPITKIEPRGENLIRIVRTAEHPIMEEESYRLFVDELPDASQRRSGTVTLVVRHSIPVFFGPSELTPANPSWSVARVKDGYEVSVRNSGGQRFRIADLVLSEGGRVLASRDGLLGYVLGGAEMRWTLWVSVMMITPLPMLQRYPQPPERAPLLRARYGGRESSSSRSSSTAGRQAGSRSSTRRQTVLS